MNLNQLSLGEKGMVIEVTDQTFEAEVLKSDIPVVVDFWAPWCGPCRMLSPVVDKLSKEYAGKVKFCKMNTDENQTPRQYHVMSIPNLLYMDKGQVVDTSVGALPEAELKSRIENLL